MSDTYCVDETRRSLHISTELLAVTVAVPILLGVAAAPKLTKPHRTFLRALAVSTLLVDGWLLWRWKQDDAAL